MSRSRSLLHLNKLAAFQAFCESQGWLNEPVKGPYERLRMTKNGREILIVYARDSAIQHCTVHGVAKQMAHAFINQRKPTQTGHSAHE
jgi:hypothetical protein